MESPENKYIEKKEVSVESPENKYIEKREVSVESPENKEIRKTYITFYGLFDLIWSLLNFLDTNYTAKTRLINGLNYINQRNPNKIIDVYNSNVRNEFIKLINNIKEHIDYIVYPTYGLDTQPFKDIFSSIIVSHTKGEITAYKIYENLKSYGLNFKKSLDGQLKDINGGVDLYNDKIEIQCKPFISCVLENNRYKVFTSGIKNYKVGMIMAFYKKETNEFLYFLIKEGDMGINKSQDFCTFSYDSKLKLKKQPQKPILTN
jgi:hypothetical protein